MILQRLCSFWKKGPPIEIVQKLKKGDGCSCDEDRDGLNLGSLALR